jgi:hypothetical protein
MPDASWETPYVKWLGKDRLIIVDPTGDAIKLSVEEAKKILARLSEVLQDDGTSE